ncbi:cytochrome P450 [Streptomyces griseoaurantiacus]|uniref:cytochrome P450 n=1 Tax=Streptomyces griseoaurantiacus TaxID=68213 RepID=UPI00346053E9
MPEMTPEATRGAADQAGPAVPVFKPYTAKADFPWEELARDRSRCPVAHSEHLDAVQISSYAGVKEVMNKVAEAFTGTYSTLWPLTEPLPVDQQVFPSADPPRHTRQRKLFVKALSASRIAHMRPFSERLAERLLDGILARGTGFDLVTAYSRRISEGHIAELLGLPEELRERFMYLSTLTELSTADGKGMGYRAELDEWQAQLAGMVRERRAAGEDSDDLITRLCFAEDEGDRLSELEVASLIRAMIRAGNTTSAAALTNTVAALERHPEQKVKYLADIEGLTPSLVEEGLRYDGPALGLWRRCARETTVQGYPLTPGDRVFTVTAAANHDPEVYDRPDEFLIDRDWKELPPHLTFGWGIHHCIGVNLARLELETSLAALYRRLPGLRLEPGAEIPQVPGPVFRNWLSLPMVFDPVSTGAGR